MNNHNILRWRKLTIFRNKNFNWWLIRGGLDLDDSTIWVVLTKGIRQRKEPGFGVLWWQRGKRGEEESDERNTESKIEPEGKRVLSLGVWVRIWSGFWSFWVRIYSWFTGFGWFWLLIFCYDHHLISINCKLQLQDLIFESQQEEKVKSLVWNEYTLDSKKEE